MSRPSLLRYVPFLLAGLLLAPARAQTPDGKGPSPRRPGDQKKIAALREKLQSPITFTGIDDPEATLADALDYLKHVADITFDVNEPALKCDEVTDPLKVKLGKPIPPMKNVSLATVLRKVLATVPVPSGVTFVARGEGIEITSGDAYRAEFYPDRPDGPFPPLVSVNVTNKPLEEILKLVSEDAGANILLDASRVGDKAAVHVDARLTDVPLDTAVLLLADMAGLESVQVDGVYYVTTKDNAEALRKKLKPRAPKPERGM
jgi:hypothetical protein